MGARYAFLAERGSSRVFSVSRSLADFVAFDAWLAGRSWAVGMPIICAIVLALTGRGLGQRKCWRNHDRCREQDSYDGSHCQPPLPPLMLMWRRNDLWFTRGTDDCSERVAQTEDQVRPAVIIPALIVSAGPAAGEEGLQGNAPDLVDHANPPIVLV